MSLEATLKNPKERKKVLIAGGAIGVLLVLVLALKKKSAAAAPATATQTATTDPTIDPATGIPYADEVGATSSGLLGGSSGGGGDTTSSSPTGTSTVDEFADFTSLLGTLFPGGIQPPNATATVLPAPAASGQPTVTATPIITNPTNTGTAGTGSGSSPSPSAPFSFNAKTTTVEQQIADVKAGLIKASQLGPTAATVYKAGYTSTAQYQAATKAKLAA